MGSTSAAGDRELPLVYVTSLSDDSRKKLESLGIYSVQQLYGLVVQGNEMKKVLGEYLSVPDRTLDNIVEECRGVLKEEELAALEKPVEPNSMPLGALPEHREEDLNEKSGEKN